MPLNTSLLTPREKHDGWYEYDDNNDFYVERYDKVEDLIDRIKHMYSLYIERGKDRYPDIYSEECPFRQVIVSNEQEEHMVVGLNPYGWDFSISLYGYLCDYFEKHYGKDKGVEMPNKKANTRQVWLYCTNNSEPYIAPAYDSVSEETATIVLKNFFAGIDKWQTFHEVHHQEIEKRNYLK